MRVDPSARVQQVITASSHLSATVTRSVRLPAATACSPASPGLPDFQSPRARAAPKPQHSLVAWRTTPAVAPPMPSAPVPERRHRSCLPAGHQGQPGEIHSPGAPPPARLRRWPLLPRPPGPPPRPGFSWPPGRRAAGCRCWERRRRAGPRAAHLGRSGVSQVRTRAQRRLLVRLRRYHRSPPPPPLGCPMPAVMTAPLGRQTTAGRAPPPPAACAAPC